MKERTMYVEISDGFRSQTKKVRKGLTTEEAIALVEEMFMADENGYSYYLLDEDKNEIIAYEQ